MRMVQVMTAATLAASIIFMPRQALVPWANYILVAAMVLSFSEYVVTHVIIKRYGIECEGNPLLRWVINRGGVYGMAGFWLLIWLAIWWFLAGPGYATFLLIFNCGILVNNILTLRALNNEQQAVSR